MTHVLVTGGAGYIGSHACKALRNAGFTPVTYDNLSTGRQEAVRFGPFEQGDILDRDRLDQVFAQYRPAAVLHFAALSLVGESVQKPGLYWRNNVQGSLTLYEAALAANCRNIVFSSTCATYGEQDGVTLDETCPQKPCNPYGATKRAIEDMLTGFSGSHGLRHVIFRYFNVAGADPEAEIGECHDPETHLIPIIAQTLLGQRPALTVFGTDYPTPDGTCIRDYVHVSDLVDAHVLGLQWLLQGKPDAVFNLGTGSGFSVREVIDHFESVVGQTVPVAYAGRRPGDAAVLVSGSENAKTILGWTPKRSDLKTMIADAWRWHQREASRH